jgi:hypothetical protein
MIHRSRHEQVIAVDHRRRLVSLKEFALVLEGDRQLADVTAIDLAERRIAGACCASSNRSVVTGKYAGTCE